MAPVLRRGPSPLDRRRRVRGRLRSPREAKPKRSHACVANPLRVDRGRPHQNQGKPIREWGWSFTGSMVCQKRTYLVLRITKRRLLCELSRTQGRRHRAQDKVPVRVRVKLLPIGSADVLEIRAVCVRDGSPQGGRPACGASAQPTARPAGRRPIFCSKILRRHGYDELRAAIRF